MKNSILLSFILLFFIRCNNEPKPSSQTSHVTPPNEVEVLQEEALSTQQFTIDSSKEYTLITQSGLLVQISKGSFESSQNPVHLELKEALSMVEIAKAGLLTQSNDQILQSGGMFKIGFEEQQPVKIKKPLRVMVPTKDWVDGMQLYQGEKDSSGRLNWVNPKPLNPTPEERMLASGKSLFQAKCASCHASNMISPATGPALGGIEQHRSKDWIYRFTRNSAQVLANQVFSEDGTSISADYYAQCIFDTWQKTVMPPFPELSNQQLDAIYAFIKKETAKHPEYKPSLSCDSCERYSLAVEEKQREIYKERELQTNLQNHIQVVQLKRNVLAVRMKQTSELFRNVPKKSNSPVINTNRVNTTTLVAQPIQSPPPELVTGMYYDLNISTLGWYNIDILIEGQAGVAKSSLSIRIQESTSFKVRLQCLIPAQKISLAGFRKADELFYIKYEDGNILLPQGATCVLIAIAEQEEKLYADTLRFIATRRNEVVLKLEEVNPNKLNLMLNSMHLNDLKSSVSVNESFKEYQKATQEMEQVQKEIDQVNQRIQEKQQRIQALEYLRPKSCNCLKAIVEMNAPYPSQAGPRDSSSSQLKNKFSNLDQGDIKQP